ASFVDHLRLRAHLLALFLALSWVGCVRTLTPQPSAIAPSRRPDPLIAKIVSDVSEQRVEAVLRKLESFETRNTLSDPSQPNRGIGAARQWIVQEFKSYSPRL